MANLIRRSNDNDDLTRWDPFQQMRQFFTRGETEMFEPKFEVADHKDRFVLKADMPGVKEQDVDVKITGNRLVVSGKRECEHEDKSDTYYSCERSYGSFTRAFTLPLEVSDVDHATASLDNGVLTIAIPKKEQAQSRKLEVKGQQRRS